MTSKYEIPDNEQLLAKEFEKLGRLFFDKVQAKSFAQAYQRLDQLPPKATNTQHTKVHTKNKRLIE